MHTRVYRKADGRRLLLYGTAPHTLAPLPEGAPAPVAQPHLRWHLLRGEWVIYAAHRQERTFLPPAEVCPLCPSRPGGEPTEIPFEDFEVAVFENRFPALVPGPPAPPALAVETAPAGGACEVVVYTAAHTGSLATLPQERRELLLRVWADRCQDLFAREAIRSVMPFENRGEVVGVTLHHPHGQIYAYPFVPPVLQREAAAFRQRSVLEDLLAHAGDAYLVDGHDAAVALAPPCARFPYEVWVVPRRRHAGPWTFDEAEVAGFAAVLGRVVARYDALFAQPFPYIMVLHAAPRGEEQYFHFHAEFYPLLRAPGRLKYLAGTELGAGAFTVDVLPEEAAAALRQVRV
ncbi:MAG: galactose-1-phosphate uridylyltransferase [Armatimonadota bacterium]|nr:galactose-1-phosphate uridylyltransferase [Armatimonadota bacterium]MDR7518613.1 galactose-1-phosphate uridylyltransferase [Armatimonadota bacterium]MDR7548480.1 galactose-1-phosphate uridylyltransferase [Armatimonadota bacterium]